MDLRRKKICFLRRERIFLRKKKNLLLAQEEDLLLAQEEDLLPAQEEDLLAQEEDLLLGQEEDLILAQEEDLLFAQEEDLRLAQEEDLLLVQSTLAAPESTPVSDCARLAPHLPTWPSRPVRVWARRPVAWFAAAQLPPGCLPLPRNCHCWGIFLSKQSPSNIKIQDLEQHGDEETILRF